MNRKTIGIILSIASIVPLYTIQAETKNVHHHSNSKVHKVAAKKHSSDSSSTDKQHDSAKANSNNSDATNSNPTTATPAETDSSASSNEALKKPILDNVEFSGNKAISSDELMKAVQVSKNSLIDENIILQDMMAINEVYKKQNLKVTIAPSVVTTSHGHAKITYQINEIPPEKAQ